MQLPPAFGALSGVDIPAGNKAYKVTDSFTLPIDVEAFAISAHAHYLGKHLQMTATLPTGKQLNLLDIPDWDFSWQEQYQFKDFIKLPKGTRLDSMVVWDNSATNPNNPTVPPVRVRWGVESEDEMGSLTLLCRPATGERYATLTTAYARHLSEVRTRTTRKMATRVQGANGDALLDALLRRNDRNRNGQIDLSEAPRWLKSSFNRVDTNNDNAIDAAELRATRDRLKLTR